MNRYWVYIVASISRTLYIGVTNPLQRRVAEHQRGEGARFTRKYRAARLVYYEASDDIRAAIAR